MNDTLIRPSFFLFLFLSFNSFSIPNAFAQKDYVENDSAYIQGTLTDRGIFSNNREIKFVREKETRVKVFHPGDLDEFGFNNGDIYISKIVEDGDAKTAYFLLEQVNGNAKLFVLQTKKSYRFFTEKNDELIELKNDGSFRITLSQVLNRCPGFENSFSLVKRNKASLSRVFTLYNTCYDGLFPTVRAGFIFGYSATNFATRDPLYHYVAMQGQWSPFFGAFIEAPLGLKPKWFANLQIQYQQNTYSASKQYYNTRSDYQINTSGLSFPILFKYRSTSRKFRPFILGGPTFSFFMQHQSKLFETTTTSNSVTKYDLSLNNISQYQLSATLGLGTEYSINPKNSVALEVRYSAGSGLREDNNQLVYSLQVLCSVFF